MSRTAKTRVSMVSIICSASRRPPTVKLWSRHDAIEWRVGVSYAFSGFAILLLLYSIIFAATIVATSSRAHFPFRACIFPYQIEVSLSHHELNPVTHPS